MKSIITNTLDTVDLVVCIATYNGGDRLRRTLESYCFQTLPHDHWIIAIVNNGSTDETQEIIESFNSKLPMIDFKQNSPGKNVSLNFAIDNLPKSGANFIFTDDDAIVGPDFLKNWLFVISEKLTFDLFGGLVTPLFPKEANSSIQDFSDYFDVLFAKNDRPNGEISAGDIYGPNMAVRGRIFEAGYRFNETIGPASSNKDYPMGSETEFCLRVEAEIKCRSWFTRSTSVDHIIRKEQVSRQYILTRAERHGRGYALREQLSKHKSDPKSLTFPRKLALSLLRFLPIARFQWNWAWHKGYHDGKRSMAKQIPSEVQL